VRAEVAVRLGDRLAGQLILDVDTQDGDAASVSLVNL
jgi:hypothetical protein